MSSTLNSNSRHVSNKNGEALPLTKPSGVSSRDLMNTITQLEAIREEIQGIEAKEAELQNQLTRVQELIAQKQHNLDSLEEKSQELQEAQAALEQLLFAQNI